MTVFRPDTSFPFLAIARKHSVSYASVLKLAERDEWWNISSELRIDVQRAVEAEQRRREEVAYQMAMEASQRR